MAEVCDEVDANLIARSFEYFADYFIQLASFYDHLEESLCVVTQTKSSQTPSMSGIKKFKCNVNRPLSYRNRPSIVLKIPQNQRKTPFYIRAYYVFNANLSNSAKRTIS